jgi:hypothetical protein
VRLRAGLALAAAGGALAVPTAAVAQVQQVLLPGPTPYPTQSPPLISGGVAPAGLSFLLRATSTQRVVAGLSPDGRVRSVRVRHSLVLKGKGDYLIAISAPVDDVRAAPGSESEPGLRTGQVLWSGFSPGRKVLAADVTLLPAQAARFLPLRLRAAREGNRYTLTVANATTVAEPVYEGLGSAPELAGLLDRTRRESLAGGRVTTAYASIEGLVHVRPEPARISGPFRVEGSLRFPTAPVSAVGGVARGRVVSFSGVLGDRRPLSLRVTVVGGGGFPKVRVVGTPATLVEALVPPGAPTWAEARRRRRLPAGPLLTRLIETRMQLVRSDQYRAFLSNPDARGSNDTIYVYESAARVVASGPAALEGGDAGTSGLVVALVVAGSILAAGAALVAWAHA